MSGIIVIPALVVALEVRWYSDIKRGLYTLCYEQNGKAVGGTHLLAEEDAFNETSAWAAAVCEAGARMLLEFPEATVVIQGDRIGLAALVRASGYPDPLASSLVRFKELCLDTGRVIVKQKRAKALPFEERRRLDAVYQAVLAEGLEAERGAA